MSMLSDFFRVQLLSDSFSRRRSSSWLLWRGAGGRTDNLWVVCVLGVHPRPMYFRFTFFPSLQTA
jgi:hypothetical protein